MEEKIIYTESDFKQGSMIGSEINSDSYLTSKFKELNDDNFTNPIYSNWQDDIFETEFVDHLIYSSDNSQLRLDVNKDNDEEKITNNKYAELETYFYDKDNTPLYTDVLSLNLNIKILDSSREEKTGIKISSENGDTQEIIFSNKGRVEIVTNETRDYITNTASNSISSITNFISNEMSDFFLDFRIQDDEINTRIRGNGFFSEWYTYSFEGLIEKLELIQYANIDTTNPVVKNLEVNKILIDGYEDGYSYTSEIVDTKENDSKWEKIEFNIINSDRLLQYTTNEIKVKVYHSNDLDTLNDNLDSFTISDISNPIIDLSDINSRYLKIKISLNTKYNNNLVEYILFKYILPSSLTDALKQVEEVIINGNLTGDSIIEYSGDNFPFKIIIPEGIDEGEIEITRHKEDELFADGVFGFEFKPMPDINKPILIEVDYTGYEFNPFMSAQGLIIGYLDISGEPQPLDTVTIESENKILAYFI